MGYWIKRRITCSTYSCKKPMDDSDNYNAQNGEEGVQNERPLVFPDGDHSRNYIEKYFFKYH